jgi:cation-transporting ATPase 13A1
MLDSITLYRSRPTEWHVYSMPSLIIYIFWSWVKAQNLDFLKPPEFGWMFFILCVSLHALLFLVCQWSVSAKALFTCSRVDDPRLADCVLANHNGFTELCKLIKNKDIHFLFQKEKFILDDKEFKKLKYLDSGDIRHFKSLSGLSVKSSHMELYGLNRFDVPIPSFQALFKEHMVAPFFIFQVFCVCLWFLDEMWYYSLFTLFMLIVFEATVVFQRLKTLQEFRSMSIPPYDIYAYRDKKWSLIRTDQIFPGDLCSIKRDADNPVPADFLILDGNCIANEAMLSGESTPQLKESIRLRHDTDLFDWDSDKAHILFGGTKLVQVTPPPKETKITTPDGGCLAVALRTGFGTEQGKLVRTIIYSTERVSANNVESLVFILFLLFFAIIASWYVWTTGIKEDERDRSKLLLHCIMIITSVVPPELPMELSLAVNNALMKLSQVFVFCTEPFRIPFAGRIDVACFDKTGTLTEENLVVEGVSGIDGDMDISSTANVSSFTKLVLASAHSLALLDDSVIGDPMEKNALDSINWRLEKESIVTPVSNTGQSVSLVISRRFAFSSSLKRMSTISYLVEGATKTTFIATKGAPETLKSMFKSVPANYDENYKYWARRGKRVLALGYRKEKQMPLSQIQDLHRDEVECNLIFAGFLIFFCPLKEDSIEAIDMLNESSHRCIMITGDNALTACHISKQVKIVSRKVMIADMYGDNENKVFAWKSVDETICISDFDLQETAFDSRLKSYDLCCTGAGLDYMINSPCFVNLLPRIWIYARVSPTQKETILTRLKQVGYFTIMCGDGTNDVGALKQAHVGIALLDASIEDMKELQKRAVATRQKMMLEKQEELRVKWGAPQSADKKQQMNDTMNLLLQDLEGEAPVIKFGDASVAAPFTSKISSVMSGFRA